MAGPSTVNFNTLYPDLQADALALQRQQALASMLMQEGMTPTPINRSSGRYITPISPFEALSKVGQAAAGAYTQKSLDDKQRALMQRGNDRLAAMFGFGGTAPAASEPVGAGLQPRPSVEGFNPAGSGDAAGLRPVSTTPTPGSADATPSSVPRAGGPLTMPGMSSAESMLAFQLDPNAYISAYLRQKSPDPTNIEKLLRAAGVREGSPEWNAAIQGNLRKENYIAPVVTRPGAQVLDPISGKPISYTPDLTTGMALIPDASDPTGFRIMRPRGWLDAKREEAGTTERAQQENRPITVTEVGPDGQPRQRTGWAGDVIGRGQQQPPAGSLPPSALPPDVKQAIDADMRRIGASQGSVRYQTPSGMVEGPVTAPAPSGAAGAPSGVVGPTPTQSTVIPGTQAEAGKDVITNYYRPTLTAGRAAQDVNRQLDILDRLPINDKTTWGMRAKIEGARFLVGLGFDVKDAKDLASDAQIFDQTVGEQVWKFLSSQTGPQTEGDAQRAGKLYSSITGTPAANQFNRDMLRAINNRRIAESEWVRRNYPRYLREGNLQLMEADWQDISPSVFADPVMKKWEGRTPGADAPPNTVNPSDKIPARDASLQDLFEQAKKRNMIK